MRSQKAMTYTLTSTDTVTIVSVSSDPDAATGPNKTGIFGHVRQYTLGFLCTHRPLELESVQTTRRKTYKCAKQVSFVVLWSVKPFKLQCI